MGRPLMKQDCPNPKYEPDARWLGEFMRRHHLTKQAVSLITGENQARVCERLSMTRPLPANIQRRLERWEADGCPLFSYWQD